MNISETDEITKIFSITEVFKKIFEKNLHIKGGTHSKSTRVQNLPDQNPPSKIREPLTDRG